MAPEALAAGLLIALVPFTMTRYVHPHLHADPGGLIGRLLQPLRIYHAEHHRRPWLNFNLVPGGDALLGTQALGPHRPHGRGSDFAHGCTRPGTTAASARPTA